jgi:hypothetical protein
MINSFSKHVKILRKWTQFVECIYYAISKCCVNITVCWLYFIFAQDYLWKWTGAVYLIRTFSLIFRTWKQHEVIIKGTIIYKNMEF